LLHLSDQILRARCRWLQRENLGRIASQKSRHGTQGDPAAGGFTARNTAISSAFR
jgi:hypothetical protein